MAMQTVHTAFTFGFDKSKFGAIETGVKRATGNLRNATMAADKFSGQMRGFWQRARGIIGAYVGFRAIKSLTTDYAKGADQIAKFSAGLGISSQQYQRMTHAAQLSGITVEELNMAIPKLAKSAGDAADGSKSMAWAFRRAGVSLKDSSGHIKDPIRLMTELADGIKNMGDKGRKTQVLMNIFGRAGKKMGVLLDQGSEGIKKAMAEADKLGIVLSQKQLKAAENYNDEMLRVKSVMLGIRNTIAGAVLPVLTRQLRAFQLWYREGKNAERFLRALKNIAFFTSIVIGRLITGFVIKQIKSFTTGLWAMVRAFNAANLAATVTAIKVTLIAAAILLVAAIIQDLVYFAQGKDSLIGRILGKSELADTLRKALIGIGKAAVDAWKELKPALLDAWTALKPALAELWPLLKPIIGEAFRIGVYAVIAAVKYFTLMIKGLVWQVNLLRDAINWVYNSFIKLADYLGIDLNKVLKNVSTAFGALKQGIMIALSPVIFALEKVIALKNKVFGEKFQEAETSVGGFTKRFENMTLGNTTLSPSGAPVMAGLFQPSPVAAYAGAGGQRFNTNVGDGAIRVTVNTTGDPAQIGRIVKGHLKTGLGAVFNGAARDMKKAPAGQ